MEKIYCISGLGADQRIFQNLHLPGYELVPVSWAPFDKYDDLPCYAQKMAARIEEENPIIIGISFGGMIASEIAMIRRVKKVFLVSSAKDATELPKVGEFVKFIVHYGLLPVGLTKVRNKETFKRFGAETDEEKDLLMSILKGTDNGFAKWAMRAIVEWKTNRHKRGLVHIHGTADRILTPENVEPTHWIEGGTHFMIYKRAVEIGQLMQQHLQA